MTFYAPTCFTTGRCWAPMVQRSCVLNQLRQDEVPWTADVHFQRKLLLTRVLPWTISVALASVFSPVSINFPCGTRANNRTVTKRKKSLVDSSGDKKRWRILPLVAKSFAYVCVCFFFKPRAPPERRLAKAAYLSHCAVIVVVHGIDGKTPPPKWENMISYHFMQF